VLGPFARAFCTPARTSATDAVSHANRENPSTFVRMQFHVDRIRIRT